MEAMSGLDAAFLAAETPRMHMHVGAVMVFDPPGRQLLFSAPARFAQLRRNVEQRLHLVPAFRQRAVAMPLGIHPPVWVEDGRFDLEYHVRRTALPEPGGAAELAALAADVMGRPLDGDRPLWEMHVVEGLADGRSALVAKMHHAIVDGVSGASLISAFLDLSPRPTVVPGPVAPWVPDEMPGEVRRLRRTAGFLARQPGAVAEALRRGLDAVVEVAQRNQARVGEGEAPPPGLFDAPRTSINGAISAQRRVALGVLALEDLKLVRRVAGTTVNDVVLACVGGALRTLLERRGETAARPLVALVPFSTRGEGDDPGVPGNRVSAMLVSLATTIEDPVTRLDAVADSAGKAKEQRGALNGDLVEGLARLAFPVVSRPAAHLMSKLRAFDHLPPACNVTVSNVAGPDFGLWWAGSRLAELYPLGPIVEGVGLNVTVMSYTGRVYVGMLGCRDLLADIDALPGLVADELARLVAWAAGAVRASG